MDLVDVWRMECKDCTLGPHTCICEIGVRFAPKNWYVHESFGYPPLCEGILHFESGVHICGVVTFGGLWRRFGSNVLESLCLQGFRVARFTLPEEEVLRGCMTLQVAFEREKAIKVFYLN